MKSIRWYGPTLILLITALLVMIAGPRVASNLAHEYDTAQHIQIGDKLDSNPTLDQLSRAFKDVARFVEPSVVHIQVYAKAPSRRGSTGGGNPLEEELLRRFFGDRLPPGHPQAIPDDQPQTPAPPQGNPPDNSKYDVPQQYGNGSGWVYDKDGHIITNYHVVFRDDVKALADRVVVRFHDGSEREATVQGVDPKTDVAVLKVKGDGLIPATRAPEPVEQGEIVFAFGSPFRFEFSMSQGIVSAKGRHLGILRESQGYENFIQTDAAINPGNSGGPLTDVRGKVVGMNSAIATRTGAYNGLGFAIPVDMVARVADQLIKQGKVNRGYLGIYIEDLDARMAKTFNYTGPGVLVTNPIAGGPAEKAGIQRGDIITKVNGKDVATADQLRNLVANLPPETSVPLEVFRAGKTISVEVSIGLLPDQLSSAAADEQNEAPPPEAQSKEVLRKLGLESVIPMTRALASRYRLEFTPGVLVMDVRRGSVADSVELRRGSIITDVMGTKVTTVDELTAELNKVEPGTGVRISVRDGNVDRFVLLELPKE
ncbi:MAG: trypsin-like peptidase domain-containing protein [Phycisphaeraceae bacterium]